MPALQKNEIDWLAGLLLKPSLLSSICASLLPQDLLCLLKAKTNQTFMDAYVPSFVPSLLPFTHLNDSHLSLAYLFIAIL